MTLQGAMTALCTPFADRQIDDRALVELCEEQIAAGIHGLVAVGTTGESATLTPDEHIHVVKIVVAAARGRVPVIAGAGANSTQRAIALSQACSEVGADALLQVVPYYNKPTQEGLYQHFAAIAHSTQLPIVLYNVPSRTSCDLLPNTVARLAQLERIVAIKEATADMRRASQILERCANTLTLLSGDDFTTLPLLALGGQGTISVLSNIMPKQVSELCNAASAGNWSRARTLHYTMQPLLERLFAETNPIPVKTALAVMGRMKNEFRLPLLPASDELVAQLKTQLSAAGLL